MQHHRKQVFGRAEESCLEDEEGESATSNEMGRRIFE
jgi:hypothetical protein